MDYFVHMDRNRFQVVADDLRERMSADHAYTPVSISHIMEQYKVGPATACRAVRVLADEGLLITQRGRGISRASDSTEDSLAAVYRRIKESITDGVWRAGERLPKLDYLVSRYSVSRATVCMAVDRLSRELLVHKKGRLWIVGPRPAQPARDAMPPDSGPLAIALCNAISDRIEANAFVRPFVQALTAELRANGVDLLFAHRNVDEFLDRTYIPNQGIDAVNRSIDDWDDRYHGAAILDLWMDAEGLHEWAPVLAGAQTRPVILFDSAGDRRSLTRSELDVGNNYYHLYFDEDGAVELALSRLAAAGHRTVGMPIFTSERGGWVGHRVELIKKRITDLRPSITLVPATVDEPAFDVDIDSPTSAGTPWGFSRRLAEWIRSQGTAGSGKGVSAQPGPEQVLRRTQSLTGLVCQGVTSLLCLNDGWAQQCYLWCLAAGLRVPADISIVSFDNHPDHQMLPLATIDFGFSRLGYLAGRILCGALPSEVDRTGDIPGISALVNRGSLGPPNNKTAGRVRAMLH